MVFFFVALNSVISFAYLISSIEWAEAEFISYQSITSQKWSEITTLSNWYAEFKIKKRFWFNGRDSDSKSQWIKKRHHSKCAPSKYLPCLNSHVTLSFRLLQKVFDIKLLSMSVSQIVGLPVSHWIVAITRDTNSSKYFFFIQNIFFGLLKIIIIIMNLRWFSREKIDKVHQAVILSVIKNSTSKNRPPNIFYINWNFN